MRRLKARPLLLSLLALALTGPAAADVAVEGRLWTGDLTGRLLLRDDGLAETVDLDGDLGLGEDESLEGRIVFRPTRRTLIRLGFAQLSFGGDEVVSRTVRFGGRDFDVSTRVVSALDLDYGRVAFGWQFLSFAEGRVRLGPIVEAKGFRGDASLVAPDVPIPLSATEEFEAGFASAGLILDIEAGRRVHLFAELTELVEDEGDLTDAEAGVRIFVTPSLALVGGVRNLEVDVVEGDETFVLEVDGVFFGARFEF